MKRLLQWGGGALAITAIVAALTSGANARGARSDDAGQPESFRRIATFPVYRNSDVGLETAAEILAATNDGRTLVYTDSPGERLGFIDIADPESPQPGGTLALNGEPTSVAVLNRWALVGVNTSANYVTTSGYLAVVDIANRTIVASVDLGGQPDSVAVSPDGRYVAIAIENERDEDLGDGAPPQAPAGYLSVVNTTGSPSDWTAKKVDLTGIADLYPTDPEPEYVDINKDNVACVTLQENNHIVLVDLASCAVVGGFSCGAVDLDDVDANEDDRIVLADSLEAVLREPDAIHWIGTELMITANEGDLDGGSRGFTIFDKDGKVRFDADNRFEHMAVRHGHYPENRSENKGSEPEGVTVARYGNDQLAFVGSERGNFVAVFRLVDDTRPEFKQFLPCTNGPEGLLAIPNRKLFVVASEVEDPGEGLRSTVAIFRLESGGPAYPEVVSANDGNGLPIPWGALSALAADRTNENILWAVTDSYYSGAPRILKIDTGKQPAVIVDEILVTESGKAAADLDLEGIVQRRDGGFWLASEGDDSPDLPNLLIRVNNLGEILEKVELPAAADAKKTNNGFEGVALVDDGDDEILYAAIQREWAGDPSGCIRVGEYRTDTEQWRFFYYPKSAPTSPAGGWVGLSEVVAVDKDTLAFIERDNQRGPNARIKWITEVSIKGVTPVAEGGSIPKLTGKRLVRDLLKDLDARRGWTQDKVEGLAITRGGRAFAVTDNDGVDDSTGETQFFRLGEYANLRK